MKNKKTFPSQPPEDNNTKFARLLKKSGLILSDLSNFLSKDLLTFAYRLTAVILIGQLLLMSTGLMEFSWKKVGITLFLMFLLRSNDIKRIL